MSTNKVVVFTQTYTDNRDLLFQLHDKDTHDIQFRNAFDRTLYAFHNCSEAYTYHTTQSHSYFNDLNHLRVIQYNGMSYTETFRQTLLKCYQEGFQYMIFFQDDVFTIEKDVAYIDSLIEFIRNEDFNMLHLEDYSFKFETDPSNHPPPPVVYEKGDFKVWKTTTQDFLNSGHWAMDDSPYVASIAFLLELYDEGYFQCGHICPAEGYLNQKGKTQSFDRWVCSHKMFRRYNIIGPNSWNKMEEYARLCRHLAAANQQQPHVGGNGV